MWEVVGTAEFNQWIVSNEVDEAALEDIRAALLVLREFGPALGRPLVDTLKGSRHAQMKELRVQSNGRPFRIFFGFDALRRAAMLIGGNKQSDKRFYKRMIPLADKLFDRHILETQRAQEQKRKSK